MALSLNLLSFDDMFFGLTLEYNTKTSSLIGLQSMSCIFQVLEINLAIYPHVL